MTMNTQSPVFDAHCHVGRWLVPDFAGRATDLLDSMTALASAGVLEALVMTTDARDNEGLLAAVRSWRGPVSLYFAAWVDLMRASSWSAIKMISLQ